MTDILLEWDRWSINLSERSYVMGIINVTPDSFSDGGDFAAAESAVAQGLKMVEDGADFLDIGGESTRPGAGEVGVEEELERVLPVIGELAGQVDVPISIDTYKGLVAEEAFKAGASIINDIGAGLLDHSILEAAARLGAPYIMMHMQGKPRTMQHNPVYGDVVEDVKSFLKDALKRAVDAGVSEDMIILDPGVGFGKTFDHNLSIIKRLKEFADLGRPILMGASRKAFLGHILGGVPPKERDEATAAITAISAWNGAVIHRVHDVKRAKRTLAVIDAVMRENAEQH